MCGCLLPESKHHKKFDQCLLSLECLILFHFWLQSKMGQEFQSYLIHILPAMIWLHEWHKIWKIIKRKHILIIISPRYEILEINCTVRKQHSMYIFMVITLRCGIVEINFSERNPLHFVHYFDGCNHFTNEIVQRFHLYTWNIHRKLTWSSHPCATDFVNRMMVFRLESTLLVGMSDDDIVRSQVCDKLWQLHCLFRDVLYACMLPLSHICHRPAVAHPVEHTLGVIRTL